MDSRYLKFALTWIHCSHIEETWCITPFWFILGNALSDVEYRGWDWSKESEIMWIHEVYTHCGLDNSFPRGLPESKIFQAALWSKIKGK